MYFLPRDTCYMIRSTMSGWPICGVISYAFETPFPVHNWRFWVLKLFDPLDGRIWSANIIEFVQISYLRLSFGFWPVWNPSTRIRSIWCRLCPKILFWRTATVGLWIFRLLEMLLLRYVQLLSLLEPYVQFLLKLTGFKRVDGHDTTFSNHLVPQTSGIDDEDFTTTVLII